MSSSFWDPTWLLGSESQSWLRILHQDHPLPSTQLAQMRQVLGPEKSAQLLELLDLRQRARTKFTRSMQMYFDRTGLEQATDEVSARYKASFYPSGGTALDLCCGIGGDACFLGQSCQLVAVDCNSLRCRFAAANLEVHGCAQVEVRTARAEDIDVAHYDAWHCDPDRRPDARRTVDPRRMQPDWETCQSWLRRNPHGSLKLAPATQLDPRRTDEWELEWLGHHRECRQLWLRSGCLARYPGQRVATLLSPQPTSERNESDKCQSFVAEPIHELATTKEPGQYLLEPCQVVLAAGLGPALARSLGYLGFASQVAYYTADHPVQTPLAACFHVEACLPPRIPRIRRWLREHDSAVSEVKKRGVEIDPQVWAGKLRGPAQRSVTLFVFRTHRRVLTAVATRVPLTPGTAV